MVWQFWREWTCSEDGIARMPGHEILMIDEMVAGGQMAFEFMSAVKEAKVELQT